MDELTYTKYWREVNELAEMLVSESMADNSGDKDAAMEEIQDSRLHETVDGHQWIIYTYYNLQVIQFSDNEDYYSDNFGADSLAEALESGGLDILHCHIAYWAFYADIQEAVYCADAWGKSDEDEAA